MKKGKTHISFLNPDERPNYTFTKVKACRLIDILREHADMALTPRFVKNHLKHLHTPLFEYTVQDKYKSWTIVKRIKDFIDLKQQLGIRYEGQLIAIPVSSSDGRDDKDLPSIMDFFQYFLNQMSKTEAVIQQCFTRFIGCMTTHEMKQMKLYYQGRLDKQAGGRHNESSFKKIFNLLSSWDDRLVTITQQGVYLTTHDSLEIEDHLIYSTTFSFLYGDATGYPYGIVINSSQRVLTLDAKNIFNLALFVRFLNQALKESEMSTINRFGSFARIRTGCEAKFYIDGQDYFEDVCEAFLSAKKEIFITGWMISPYFTLRRPDFKGDYRLDNILSHVANAGIKVNIIVYNGPKLALNIDSQFTQTYLSSLSDNIKVMLHPHYVLIPFLWSHHEKMIVIDQRIAFMGGLDLGYGRYDNNKHLLTDPKAEIWFGADYCNYRTSDILEPQKYASCSIERKHTPRMPWHDIGVKLAGGSVQDLARHFIQYWNYVNLQDNMDDRQLLMYVGIGEEDLQTKDSDDRPDQDYDIRENRQSIRLSNTNDPDDHNTFSLANFFKKNKNKQKISNSTVFDLPFDMEPENDKKTQSSTLACEKEELNDKEIDFYVQHLVEVSKFQNFVNMLNPKNLLSYRMGTTFQQISLSEGKEANIFGKNQKKRTQRHQVLRSASMWSLGLQADKPEHSILNSYLDLIENASEFIYIENQFFMSQCNGVMEAIVKRILKAHKNAQKFRVVIVLPALPGFDGHPADEKAAVFRVQMHLIMSTVNRMHDLLLEVLKNQYVLEDYLFIFSLRTHGVMDNTPVTQIIYVHSKIMIVDDKIALIGSANINDRSLNGARDTELALVVQDDTTLEIDTAQTKRQVNVFAHELRSNLYQQHFNITPKQAADYFNDDVWEFIIQNAKKNHDAYRQIFGCYPDNQMGTFKKMTSIEKEADKKRYDILKLIIQSNAIPFQRQFLRYQDLTIKPGQKQYFVPEINFT